MNGRDTGDDRPPSSSETVSSKKTRSLTVRLNDTFERCQRGGPAHNAWNEDTTCLLIFCFFEPGEPGTAVPFSLRALAARGESMDCVRRMGVTGMGFAFVLVLARVLASLSRSEAKKPLTLERVDPMNSSGCTSGLALDRETRMNAKQDKFA